MRPDDDSDKIVDPESGKQDNMAELKLIHGVNLDHLSPRQVEEREPQKVKQRVYRHETRKGKVISDFSIAMAMSLSSSDSLLKLNEMIDIAYPHTDPLQICLLKKLLELKEITRK